MTTQLIKYEAACRALAECTSVDEVKGWADKAAAMQAYQRMAGDRTLESQASEIRIRAERRLGELLLAQKADGGLNRGAASMAGNQHTGKVVRSSVTTAPKLADAGISKDLSSRAQKLAAVPAAQFEAELAAKREREIEDGARVSARLEKAGARHLQQKEKRTLTPEAPSRAEYEADELRASVQALAEDNERLSDRLAVEAMDATEEERTAAADTIATLRKEVRNLTAELDATRSSRDTLLVESAELKKQVAYWRRKAEKVAA